MSKEKRKELAGTGRGAVGKTAVVGMKDRDSNMVTARVVDETDAQTLQGFVGDYAAEGATVYTDDHGGYQGMPFEHKTVKHSVGEYVSGMAHTNGIESFWSCSSAPIRAPSTRSARRHLQRYVHEFTASNIRESGTLAQMRQPSPGWSGAIPRPHRGQRAFVGFRGVRVPCGGTVPLPASPALRLQDREPDRA